MTSQYTLHNTQVVMLRSTSRAYAEQYDEIHYRVRLRRYPNYYVITFILPMMYQPRTRKRSKVSLDDWRFTVVALC